jgi:hypothetical protein
MARSKVGVVLASVAQAVLLTSASTVLAAQLSAGRTATVMLVGAGDISRCDSTGDTALRDTKGGEEDGS